MYYELLEDGTIGISTPSLKVAQSIGLTLQTDIDIVYGYNGKRYFKGQEPDTPIQNYRDLRSSKYPPVEDFLDAQVKLNSGNEILIDKGQIQLDAYIAACLAIKESYPKN